jgi:hypothetical protein
MKSYPICEVCRKPVKVSPRKEWHQNPTAWSYTHAECLLAAREQAREQAPPQETLAR